MQASGDLDKPKVIEASKQKAEREKAVEQAAELDDAEASNMQQDYKRGQRFKKLSKLLGSPLVRWWQG